MVKKLLSSRFVWLLLLVTFASASEAGVIERDERESRGSLSLTAGALESGKYSRSHRWWRASGLGDAWLRYSFAPDPKELARLYSTNHHGRASSGGHFSGGHRAEGAGRSHRRGRSWYGGSRRRGGDGHGRRPRYDLDYDYDYDYDYDGDSDSDSDSHSHANDPPYYPPKPPGPMPVPEPSTALLWCVGLAAMGWFGRSRPASSRASVNSAAGARR